ncbi:hypothetical protein FGO68_gene8623 [Halteria grandinella]|uniref:Uncharacterized protein n=1 Tax=Halteria grandinella TaxID=5974 RepID=A0A8J8NCV9_HALGN|nr:hypothetical protein FGO68_gene8623 [Halteria grandinella]
MEFLRLGLQVKSFFEQGLNRLFLEQHVSFLIKVRLVSRLYLYLLSPYGSFLLQTTLPILIHDLHKNALLFHYISPQYLIPVRVMVPHDIFSDKLLRLIDIIFISSRSEK